MTWPAVMRVITRLNVGGPARQETMLTDALEVRGYSSYLVCGEVSAEEGELTPPPGTPVTRVPGLRRDIHPIGDARAAWEIERLMRARRPKLVHTHMAKAGALGRFAAHRTDVPVVVHTFHGNVLDGYFSKWMSSAFLAAERRLARMTDALVAVSPAVRDELLALGIGRPSQWRVIPVGLDLSELLTRQVDRAQARRALGLPEAGPVVGVVGRLVPIKDHLTFLDAASRVALTRPDVTFVVVGDGELRSELETRARRSLRGTCRFLGWVMDLPTLYAALDVVVLTSRNEGTPVALIEAGAAGKPAVATCVGGVGDVIRDGQTGVLVQAGDARAIAAGISRLLDEPSRARAFGEAARREVRLRFTNERLADDLAGLYGELLAEKGLPGPHPQRG